VDDRDCRPRGYTLALTNQGKDFDDGQEPVALPMQDGPLVTRGSSHFIHDVEQDRPAEVVDGDVTLVAGIDRRRTCCCRSPRASDGTILK
jgi:hypothetical protein